VHRALVQSRAAQRQRGPSESNRAGRKKAFLLITDVRTIDRPHALDMRLLTHGSTVASFLSKWAKQGPLANNKMRASNRVAVARGSRYNSADRSSCTNRGREISLRESNAAKEAKLEQAQDDLRKLLTPRQEAVAVLGGMLK